MASDPTKEWRPKLTGIRRSVVWGAFELVTLEAQAMTERGLRWVTMGELCGVAPSSCLDIMQRFGFDGTVPPGAAEEAERSRMRMVASLSSSLEARNGE